MFRFNPGKDLKIFPDKHPYFPRGCDRCEKNFNLAYDIPKNELCQTCAIVKAMRVKQQNKIEKEKYRNEMLPLLSERIKKTVDVGEITVKFNASGNKHLYSDTLGRAKGILLKDDLKNLDNAINNAEFIKSATLGKERKDKITKFYYFKDRDKELYYNVAEVEFKRKSGKIKYSRFLYSATRNLKSDE